MLFLNQTDGPVFLPIGQNGIRVKAKDTIEIPDGYAHPRRADNGSRRPSVVEELAGGIGTDCKLVPADPTEKATWLQAPPVRRSDATVATMPTVEGFVAQGVPRAQAEQLVRQAHQAIIDAMSAKDEPKPAKMPRHSPDGEFPRSK